MLQLTFSPRVYSSQLTWQLLTITLSTVSKHLVQTPRFRVSALVYFQYSNIKAAKGEKLLPSLIYRSVGVSLYFSKKETKTYLSGCLCLILNALLCFLGVEEISTDKCLWQNVVCEFSLLQKLCNMMSLTQLHLVGKYHQDLL